MIYREEYIGSRTADTNDYFADPMLVLDADILFITLTDKVSALFRKLRS